MGKWHEFNFLNEKEQIKALHVKDSKVQDEADE